MITHDVDYVHLISEHCASFLHRELNDYMTLGGVLRMLFIGGEYRE